MTSGTIAFTDDRDFKFLHDDSSDFLTNRENKLLYNILSKDIKTFFSKSLPEKNKTLLPKVPKTTKDDILKVVAEVVPDAPKELQSVLVRILGSIPKNERITDKLLGGFRKQIDPLFSTKLNDSEVKKLVGSVAKGYTLSHLLTSEKIKVANQYKWVEEFVKGEHNYINARLNYKKESNTQSTESAYKTFDSTFSPIIERNREIKEQIKANRIAKDVVNKYSGAYNRLSSLKRKTEEKRKFSGAYNTFTKHYGDGRSYGNTLKDYFITERRALRPDVYKEIIASQRSSNQNIQNDIDAISRYRKRALPGEEFVIDLLLGDLKSAKRELPLRTSDRIKHDIKNDFLGVRYTDYYKTLYGEDPREGFSHDTPGRLQKYHEYLAKSILNVENSYDNLIKSEDVGNKPKTAGLSTKAAPKRSLVGDIVGNALMTSGSVASMVLPVVGPMLGGSGMAIKSTASSIAKAGKFGRATAIGGAGSALLAGSLDGSYTMTGLSTKFAEGLIKGAEWGIEQTLGNIPGVGGTISKIAGQGVDSLISSLPSSGNLLSEYLSGSSLGTTDIILSAINHGPAIAGGVLGSLIISGILSKGYNTIKEISDFNIDTGFIKDIFSRKNKVITVDGEIVNDISSPKLKGNTPMLPGDDDIPKFAKGGFVKNPLFGLIGEMGPEVVLPLDGKVLGELASKIVNSFYEQAKGGINSLKDKSSIGGVDYGKYFSKDGLRDIASRGFASTILKDIKTSIESVFETPLNIAKELYSDLKTFIVNYDFGNTIKDIKSFARDFRDGFAPTIEIAKDYFDIAKNYIKVGYEQDVRRLRKTVQSANNLFYRGLDVVVGKVDSLAKYIEKKDKKLYNAIGGWLESASNNIKITYGKFTSYFLSGLETFGKKLNVSIESTFSEENIKNIKNVATEKLKTTFNSFVSESYNLGKGLYDRSQMAMAWIQTQRDIIREKNYTNFGSGPAKERVKTFGRGFVEYIGQDTTFREYLSKLTVLTGSLVEDLFVESRNMIRAGVALIKGTSADSSSQFTRFRKLAEDNFVVFKNKSSELFSKFNAANERIGKAFGGRDNALKDVILKPIMFSLAKMIPGAGVGAGAVLTGQRLANKDYRGANLESLSGLAGAMGLTPVSALISAGLFLRDMNIKGGIRSLRGIDMEENIEKYDPEAAADPGIAAARRGDLRRRRLSREEELRTRTLNTISKAIPVLGLVAGPILAVKDLIRGNKFGAAANLLSGVAGGMGIAPLSMAISGASAVPGAKQVTRGVLGSTDVVLKSLLGPNYAKESAKALLKFGLKNIPIVGAVAGSVFAAKKLTQGDKFGAALEFIGGVAGGLGGPVAGMVIDSAIPFLEGLSAAIPGIVDNLAPFATIFSPIASFWENVGGIGGFIGSIFNPLGFEALGEALEYFKIMGEGTWLGEIGRNIVTATKVTSAIVGEFSTAVVDLFDSGVKTVAEKTLNWISTFNTDTTKGFLKLGEAFKPLGTFIASTGLGSFINMAIPIRQFFMDSGDDPFKKKEKKPFGTRIKNFISGLGPNKKSGFLDGYDPDFSGTNIDGRQGPAHKRVDMNMSDFIKVNNDIDSPELEKKIDAELKSKPLPRLDKTIKKWWENRKEITLNMADKMKVEYDPSTSTVGLGGFLRKIPGLALAISGYHASRRALQGDWEGARLESLIGIQDHASPGGSRDARNILAQRDQMTKEQRELKKKKDEDGSSKDEKEGDNKVVIDTKGGDLNNVNLTQESGDGAVKAQDNDKTSVFGGMVGNMKSKASKIFSKEEKTTKKKKDDDDDSGGGLLGAVGGAIVEGVAEEAAEGFFKRIFKRGRKGRNIAKVAKGSGLLARGSGGLAKIGTGILGGAAALGGLAKNAKGIGKGALAGIKGAKGILGKTALKSLLKKAPGLGLLVGAGLGIGRLVSGDPAGAAMELASGATGAIPGLGTAASVGIDAALLARDIRGVDKEKATYPTVIAGSKGIPLSSGSENVDLLTKRDKLMANEISSSIWKDAQQLTWWDKLLNWFGGGKEKNPSTDLDPAPKGIPLFSGGNKLATGMTLATGNLSGSQDLHFDSNYNLSLGSEEDLFGGLRHKYFPEYKKNRRGRKVPLSANEKKYRYGTMSDTEHPLNSSPYAIKELSSMEEVGLFRKNLLQDHEGSDMLNNRLDAASSNRLGIFTNDVIADMITHSFSDTRKRLGSSENPESFESRNAFQIRENLDVREINGVNMIAATDGKLYPQSEFVFRGNHYVHKNNSNIIASADNDDRTYDNVHARNSGHTRGIKSDISLGGIQNEPWVAKFRRVLTDAGIEIIGPGDGIAGHDSHLDIRIPRSIEDQKQIVRNAEQVLPPDVFRRLMDRHFPEFKTMVSKPSVPITNEKDTTDVGSTQSNSEPVLIAPVVNNVVDSEPTGDIVPSMSYTRSELPGITVYDAQHIRLSLV